MAEPGNAPVNIGETRDLVALRAFRVQIPIPASHCSLDRKTGELIYSKLPPVLQNLLPNKALAEYKRLVKIKSSLQSLLVMTNFSLSNCFDKLSRS